jgi:hypothetical protein
MKKLAGLLALSLLPLAACGDDGGSAFGGAGGGGATEESLESTARAMWDAVKAEDFDAMWEQMTDRCRATYDTQSDFTTEMRTGIGLLESFFEVDLSTTEVDAVEITEFTPERALVAITIVDESGASLFDEEDESEPVVYLYEDGWKSDDCSDGDVEDVDDIEIPEPDDLDEPTDTTAAPVAEGPGSSRTEPVALGQPYELALDDAVFELTVTGAELDATATVLAADSFNEAPPEGSSYVIVRYSATVLSADSEPVTPSFSLEAKAVDSTNKELQDCSDVGAVWVEGDDGYADVYVGGTVNLEACFVVETANVGSLLLSIEGLVDFEEVRAFFAVQ